MTGRVAPAVLEKTMAGESVEERKESPRRVNVRTPEVMDRVKAEVEDHYRSEVVDKLRSRDGVLKIGDTTVLLAKQFGFCYGVERAIDLAYAARKVFEHNRIFLIGEIIHNQEVNKQLAEMGIRSVGREERAAVIGGLTSDDVVIIPAFGAETSLMEGVKARGCQIVDTTCGDVMSVWKRVKNYSREGKTSIIHGKATHEETRSTASRAMGTDGKGHYLVILTLEDVDFVCDFIRRGSDCDGDGAALLERFAGAHSEGFDPAKQLANIGVANQTTMLKSETEEMQRRLARAMRDRYGEEEAAKRFASFDTICGATQERQDALFDMLEGTMDLLLVVGGYNSSNTGHLVEIGQDKLPSFFIRDATCLKSFGEIVHFDLASKAETTSYSEKLLGEGPVTIGITAGASCPNNLIEASILRVFELRGVGAEEVMRA